MNSMTVTSPLGLPATGSVADLKSASAFSTQDDLLRELFLAACSLASSFSLISRRISGCLQQIVANQLFDFLLLLGIKTVPAEAGAIQQKRGGRKNSKERDQLRMDVLLKEAGFGPFDRAIQTTFL